MVSRPASRRASRPPRPDEAEGPAYLAAYAAKTPVDGTITGKQGDTFRAGHLGKYTVGADGTVLLGKPYVFNKANIGKFHF
jgi:rhamnose transport system substrate-binding protein